MVTWRGQCLQSVLSITHTGRAQGPASGLMLPLLREMTSPWTGLQGPGGRGFPPSPAKEGCAKTEALQAWALTSTLAPHCCVPPTWGILENVGGRPRTGPGNSQSLNKCDFPSPSFQCLQGGGDPERRRGTPTGGQALEDGDSVPSW